MHALGLVAVALLGSDPDVTPERVRSAVESSLEHLAEDAADWVRVYRCASCHHAPMMLWTAREAKQRGFKMDDVLVEEVRKFTVDDPVASKLLPAPKSPDEKPDPEAFAYSATYAMLAVHAARGNDANDATKQTAAKLEAYLLANQRADGSWALSGGRAPVLEGPEITTLMTVLVLDGIEGDEAKTARDKAQAWLDSTKPGSYQAELLRLLVATRAGASPETSAYQVNTILKRQRPDGGWSQTPEMESDAFATGQTLFVLAEAGVKPDRPEIARAHAFLVQTQTDDGNWPMTSRPNAPVNKPAENLRPITFAGSAWATLGLLKTMPASRDSENQAPPNRREPTPSDN